MGGDGFGNTVAFGITHAARLGENGNVPSRSPSVREVKGVRRQ